jgi:ABC-2 type transport system permease protein
MFASILLIGLSLYSPIDAGLALLFGAAAATCTALINLWHPVGYRRTTVIRRRAQPKLIGLIEHLMSLLWAVATGLALYRTAKAALPIGLALALLWLNRQKFAPRLEGLPARAA